MLSQPQQQVSSEAPLNHRATPEQRLLAAILARAILDATGNGRILNDPKYQRESLWWIERDSDADEEFSFTFICAHLGLCPATMRKVIKELIEQKAYLEFPPLYLLTKLITPLSELR